MLFWFQTAQEVTRPVCSPMRHASLQPFMLLVGGWCVGCWKLEVNY